MVNILQIVKKIVNPFPNQKKTSFVVPFSAGAGRTSAIKAGKNVVKAATGGIKSFFQKLPTIIKSKTVSPAAGLPFSKVPKALGKAALGGAIAGTVINLGYQGSKSTITGETPNIKDVLNSARKSAQLGASFGLSPIGALGGVLTGTEIITGQKAKETIQNLLGVGKDKISSIPNDFNIPDLPNVPSINPNPVNNFYLQGFSTPQGEIFQPVPQIQMPSMGFAPSLSVSGSAGGLGENLPLLLLLLAGGAGLGGYALGKRKKKKYKKKRKHK